MLSKISGYERLQQHNARNFAAVKFVTKASQWRKTETRGRRRKGRGGVIPQYIIRSQFRAEKFCALYRNCFVQIAGSDGNAPSRHPPLSLQDLTRSSTSEKHHSHQSSENVEVVESNYAHHQEHRDDEHKHEESGGEITENGIGEETSGFTHEVEYSSKLEAKEEIRSHVETAIVGGHRRPSTLTTPDESEVVADLLVRSSTYDEGENRLMEERSGLSRPEQESGRSRARPAPRAARPKPVFGPLTPAERPLVLPGGRRWRTPKDAYDDQFIAETLTAQAEIIKGKAIGVPYESALLAYDERINFMKYEKPPVSLDHLKHSEVYKVVHELEDAPPRRVELLTPAIAESDYREVGLRRRYNTISKPEFESKPGPGSRLTVSSADIEDENKTFVVHASRTAGQS
ncbi:hypothetical protein EVAR_54575_1 [Eumeta japonica]|uniref:Uncharacterized protein n=1 Tax=Eumeta variegata TaxID=151549 RepID=A0A4C1YHD1_EUMVA|nr:hypothetical protein EVAR_54575_1 [Eumeta japonica]